MLSQELPRLWSLGTAEAALLALEQASSRSVTSCTRDCPLAIVRKIAGCCNANQF